MFSFQKYTRFTPKLILSPQGRQQNLSLGINPIDNAELCYPHDNIARRHLCDECKRSSVPIIGHTLLSILWRIEQICLLSMGCLLYQFVLGTSISRKFVSIHRRILHLIHAPPSWIDDHPGKGLKLCTAALSFLFASSKSQHFGACPSISYDHATVFAWGFSHPRNSQLLQ